MLVAARSHRQLLLVNGRRPVCSRRLPLPRESGWGRASPPSPTPGAGAAAAARHVLLQFCVRGYAGVAAAPAAAAGSPAEEDCRVTSLAHWRSAEAAVLERHFAGSLTGAKIESRVAHLLRARFG
jgi:hypothetical protein